MVASTVDQRIAALRGKSFLAALDADAQRQVALMAKDRIYKNGAVIFAKGDPGTSMMVVMAGRVRIRVSSPDANEMTFRIFEPGEVFGEISLLDGKERSADAVAVGATHLLVIERREFIPYLQANAPVAIDLLAVVCAHARNASNLAENVAFLDVPGRLARAFVQLAKDYGRDTKDGLRIDIKLSQRELGNLIATSRESINKQLGIWQREGLLSLDDGFVVLRDLEEFERLAEL